MKRINQLTQSMKLTDNKNMKMKNGDFSASESLSLYLNFLRKEIDPFALSGKVAVMIPSWHSNFVISDSFGRDMFYQNARDSIFDFIFAHIKSSATKVHSLRYDIIRYAPSGNIEPTINFTFPPDLCAHKNLMPKHKNVEEIKKCEETLNYLLLESQFIASPAGEECHPDDLKYIIDKEWVDLLLIDYDIFSRSALMFFGKQQLNILEKSEDLEIDYILSACTSLPFWNVMNRLYQSKNLSNDDKIQKMDSIAYHSNMMSTRNIPSSLWSQVAEKGGLLGEFNLSKSKKGSNGNFNHDIPLFLSLESLFCWEIIQSLKNGHRCKNCNAFLPQTRSDGKAYRGKYCPQWVKNHKECRRSRGRKRHNKNYKKNKT